MTWRYYRRLRAPVFALVFGSMISTAVGIGQSWSGRRSATRSPSSSQWPTFSSAGGRRFRGRPHRR